MTIAGTMCKSLQHLLLVFVLIINQVLGTNTLFSLQKNVENWKNIKVYLVRFYIFQAIHQTWT